MRTFIHGSGEARKFVVLEVVGPKLRIGQGSPGGTIQKKQKEFATEAQARSASDTMAGELLARGFVEKASAASPKPAPAPAPARALIVAGADDPKPIRPRPAPSPTPKPRPAAEGSPFADLFASAGEGDSEPAAAVLPRLAPAPVAAAEPKKKKKKGGKKKKKGEGTTEELDRRVIVGIGAGAVVALGLLGLLGYDMFLRPPSIVGQWEGSRTEHEIGKFLTHSTYALVLDGGNNAVMTREGKFTQKGTYTLQGDRLRLSFPAEKIAADPPEPPAKAAPQAKADPEEDDEADPDAKDVEGGEGPGEIEVSPASDLEYKVTLGRATLDLYDPSSGKKVVQLIRMTRKVGAGPARVAATPSAAPKDLTAAEPGDAGLASIQFVADDNAFRMKYPPGWTMDHGGRSDNSYSWGKFARGSANVKVYADVAGSLMSGPDNGNHPEGSELAPVHGAHERYGKTAAELYSDYKESEPALFKGVPMGEGRVATFTASGGGMFGGQLRGIRVTFLSNDRRISVLCDAPAAEFDKVKPAFLAMCRSLSR